MYLLEVILEAVEQSLFSVSFKRANTSSFTLSNESPPHLSLIHIDILFKHV